MSKAIRFPALAAALAGALSFGAQAAVVPQTVSSFALQTTSTAGVVTDGTNTYSLSEVQTGVWVGTISSLGNGIGISGAQIVSSNGLLGLMFQSGVNAITLNLPQALQINALTINVLNAGILTATIDSKNSLSLPGNTSATQAASWQLQGDCAGAGSCASPYLLTETDTGAVKSIEFSRTNSNLLYLMTGLTFVDYSATTSNNVPEPASYGLAALALLAAGAATRRRAR